MSFLEILRRETKKLFEGRYPLIALIFGAPLAFALIFGFIYAENTVKHIPLVVYDQDQSSTSRSLLQMYADSERYAIVSYVDSQEKFEQAIRKDEAVVGLGIPRDFSKNIKTGQSTDFLLLVNSANNMFGNAALSSAQEINRSFSVAAGQKLIEGIGVLPSASMNAVYPVHFGVRILNNPTNGYTQFMLAGLMLNGLQIGLMLIVPPLLIREIRERHYGRDTSSLSILLGSVLAAWCAAVGAFLLSMLVIVYGFDVPMRGAWLQAAILGGVFACFVVGALLVFSACAPNEVLSLQAPMLYIMPGLLYSGLSWPQFAMTDLAAFLGAILPITYAGDTLRDIMLAGYAPSFWTDIGHMLLGALLSGALAAGIFSVRRHWKFRGGVRREPLADCPK
jgi:ABC-2 type transport system permease protein